MSGPNENALFVDTLRGARLRVRPDVRDGLAVVRIDYMEPLTSHTSNLTVVGKPAYVPAERVNDLCEALYRAKTLTGTPPEKGGAHDAG